MSVNSTATAAFAAAGLSFVNVAVSARLARTGSREQWRREQEQPVVAKILTISEDAVRVWEKAAEAERVWSRERTVGRNMWLKEFADYLHKSDDLYEALRYEVAQLDLLAGSKVRRTASRLESAHYFARLHRPGSAPGWSDRPFGQEDVRKIRQLQTWLIEETRADFAIDRVPSRRLRYFRRTLRSPV